MSKRRQRILDTISDLGGKFLYYDRKEDEDLGVGAIEEAVKNDEITFQEIVDAFARSIGCLNDTNPTRKIRRG